MKKRKFVIILLTSFVILFIIRNAVWYINYNKYEELITNEYELFVKSYGKNADGYQCTIKKPEIYSFVGNFSIYNNSNISIIFWPQLFVKGDMEIGIELLDTQNNQAFRFYADKELNYLVEKKNNFTEEEISQINNLLNQNKEELDKMYRIAQEEFNFN